MTAVLVAALASIWFFITDRRSGEPDPTSQSQVAELRTELDLRKFTVTRSEQGSAQPAPVSLPTGLVDLTLLMPVGSEPGAYEIQLLDANLQSRASARGVGEIRDFVTTIRARSTSARCRAAHINSRSAAKAMTGGCFRHACCERDENPHGASITEQLIDME